MKRAASLGIEQELPRVIAWLLAATATSAMGMVFGALAMGAITAVFVSAVVVRLS